jgi:hypothetical protein
MTKFNLQKLLNEGDGTERTYNDLFVAAQAYFKAALGYVLKKFPLTDEVLKHAKWINVLNRSEAKFKSVSNLGDTDIQIDAMYDEFCDYQTLTDDDIGEKAWSEAKIVDGLVDGEEIFHHRVDVLWWYISDMVVPGFPRSASVTSQRWQSLFSFCTTAMLGKRDYAAWLERTRLTAGLQ